MTRRAFTLIEMLVATALSSVLIGALLLIASRLASDRARLAQHAWVDHAGLRSLLELDLHNAEQRLSINAERIDLLGHNAIDPATLQPSFRAVTVTYELRTASHELIRQQRAMDDPSTATPWQSVIARHVKQMSLNEAAAGDARFQLELDDGVIEVSCQR